MAGVSAFPSYREAVRGLQWLKEQDRKEKDRANGNDHSRELNNTTDTNISICRNILEI